MVGREKSQSLLQESSPACSGRRRQPLMEDTWRAVIWDPTRIVRAVDVVVAAVELVGPGTARHRMVASGNAASAIRARRVTKAPTAVLGRTLAALRQHSRYRSQGSKDSV